MTHETDAVPLCPVARTHRSLDPSLIVRLEASRRLKHDAPEKRK